MRPHAARLELPDQAAVAVAIDKHLHLKDRFGTAQAIGAGRIRRDGLAPLVQADAERNLLLVKGAVPGPNGGLVMVRSAVKAPATAGKGA